MAEQAIGKLGDPVPGKEWKCDTCGWRSTDLRPPDDWGTRCPNCGSTYLAWREVPAEQEAGE